ncbi:MAG TPA: response regulator, partial [Methanomassiliicoccales archaeon]|nr:response regulator [Methanomassiliicoccales archaeon]
MITVLLIDDEESLLHLCKTYLERASDIKVDTVLSAREGEDRLLEKEYDAIVTEYHMPWRSGLELLKRIRMRRDRTPLIIFTNKGSEDVAIDSLNSGADFYLQKGGNPKAKFQALEHMVREAVHKRRWEKALALKRLAFDESPQAQLIIDIKGNILEMNPSFKLLWGYVDQNEVVGGSLN